MPSQIEAHVDIVLTVIVVIVCCTVFSFTSYKQITQVPPSPSPLVATNR